TSRGARPPPKPCSRASSPSSARSWPARRERPMPAAEVVEALRARFSAAPAPLGVSVPPSSLPEAARALRDAHGYRYYVMASATERSETIELVHAVRNLHTHDTLFVVSPLPKTALEAPSLAMVWAGAEWHE